MFFTVGSDLKLCQEAWSKSHGAGGGAGRFGTKMVDRATAGANMTISLSDLC
jgi:hypothetical protein